MTKRKGVLTLLVVSVSLPMGAQWSSDPAANLTVADLTGTQVQPKIVARADGGFYVSWFDGPGVIFADGFESGGAGQWSAVVGRP